MPRLRRGACVELNRSVGRSNADRAGLVSCNLLYIAQDGIGSAPTRSPRQCLIEWFSGKSIQGVPVRLSEVRECIDPIRMQTEIEAAGLLEAQSNVLRNLADDHT